MKAKRLITLFTILLTVSLSYAQSTTSKWKKISDDEIVAIYYDTNITTAKNGDHIVWVKAVFHSPEWQNYMAQQAGLRTPVASTCTKARYDAHYNYVMIRQVLCYNKAGKQIFNTGDDASAGWDVVNASSPVGIVGEYLGNIYQR